MIKNIESNTVSLPVTPVRATKAIFNPDVDEVTEVSESSSDTTNISILSRQLSESFARAEARDKSLTRQALGVLALKLQTQFDSEPYLRSNARNVLSDATISDPVLRDRDRQAVEYVIRDMYCDYSARNPFAGLSYEQLTVIAYDESNTFSLNERHAAFRGARRIEEAWHSNICHESQRGAFTQERHIFFAEHLAHYRSLPLIEQAQYTDGYEAKIEGWMREAANSPAYKPNDELLTLFDLIAGKVKKDQPEQQDPDTSTAATPAVKTNSLSPDVSPTPADVARS